jgi:hypothetical protein
MAKHGNNSEPPLRIEIEFKGRAPKAISHILSSFVDYCDPILLALSTNIVAGIYGIAELAGAIKNRLLKRIQKQ